MKLKPHCVDNLCFIKTGPLCKLNLECNTLIKANTYRQIIKVQMRKRVQQGTESDSVLLLSFQTILNKNIFEMTVSDSLLTMPPPMKSS